MRNMWNILIILQIISAPRTLIYLIPNTSLGAELTGVKISRM